MTDGTGVGSHRLLMGKIAVENRGSVADGKCELGSATAVLAGMFVVATTVMVLFVRDSYRFTAIFGNG